jgi:hypothetical protein
MLGLIQTTDPRRPGYEGFGSPATAVNPVTAINVKDHGAKGDGVADDRAAIQTPLKLVPEAGGVVYFPPGDYLVSGALRPNSRTLMYGCHVPRWSGLDNPDSACKIRMSSPFQGPGLIVGGKTTVQVLLRDLTLVGNGAGTGLHGLRMPDLSPDTVSESSWQLDNVTIAGFSGSGIYGRVHVAILRGCFMHNNRGWGINASNGNRWNDVHVSDCFIYYNRQGNLLFGGSEPSGGVRFVNCRFERAGAIPGQALNPSAPGVRLASARFIEFVNCNTDANCGNGFEIVHIEGSPNYLPDHISLVNCCFGRDGTGDQKTLGDYAGLKVWGPTAEGKDRVSQVKCVNCMVVWGKASDDGAGDIIGPKYGVWSTAPIASSGSAGTRAGLPIPTGSAYFDAATNKLSIRNGTAWKSVTLA